MSATSRPWICATRSACATTPRAPTEPEPSRSKRATPAAAPLRQRFRPAKRRSLAAAACAAERAAAAGSLRRSRRRALALPEDALALTALVCGEQPAPRRIAFPVLEHQPVLARPAIVVVVRLAPEHEHVH